MTVTKVIALAILSIAAFGADNKSSPTLSDYALGESAGECLASDCMIFEGTVDSVTRTPDGQVRVRVDRWISAVQHIAIGDFINFPLLTDHDPAALVWAGTNLSPHSAVIVLFAGKDVLGYKAGECILAVSEERSQRLVRNVFRAARRVEQDTTILQHLISSVAVDDRVAMAGYVFSRLLLQPLSAEQDVDILSQLLSHPSLPAEEAQKVVWLLVMQYHGLSDASRTQALRRMADTGLSTDSARAVAGLLGLSRLIAIDPSAPVRITSDQQRRIAKRYQLLTESGSMSSTRDLDRLFASK